MDIIEETMEKVGRHAEGKVEGVSMSMKLYRTTTFVWQRWVSLREIPIYVLSTAAGTTYSMHEYRNKADADTEFDRLVAKYKLVEE